MNTAKKLKINDMDIIKIQTLRDMKEVMAKKLKSIERDLKLEEENIISLMDNGASINSNYDISIDSKFKKYPKYKEEIFNRYGESILNEIIDSIPLGFDSPVNSKRKVS